MSVDLGILYRSSRDRVIELVTAPGVDEHVAVPATPEWTIHDVIAHLSGVGDDATSGNMAGAPGDAWTAAQVARGKDRSMAELLDAWGRTGPMMDVFFSSPDGAAMAPGVFDVHTHEADLRHALGLPVDVPADFLAWAAELFRGGFAGAVAEAGLPPVAVEASDFEWFRGRLGRRTVDEVSAYGWSADPGPYLDAFFIFGRAERSLGERA
ncbi:MAG: hypothetical protein RL238_422 [Actinomycetota bacterium]|jgi:uncharacterized protein (TIGR03083 family)